MPDQENRDGERFLVELHREEDMHDFLRRALTVAERAWPSRAAISPATAPG